MARRRPAPQRIHQRPRGGQCDSSRHPLSDWLNAWGTFISALAAAIGLVVSGVATWATVAALNDQRADAKQEDELRAREQAARISVWVDSEAPDLGDGVMTVSNYSTFPLDKWGVFFRIDSDPASDMMNFDVPPTAMRIVNVLPPCTQVSIDLQNFRRESNLGLEIGSGRSFLVGGIDFADAQGKPWHRQVAGDFPFEKAGLRRGWMANDSSASYLSSFKREQLSGCSGSR